MTVDFDPYSHRWKANPYPKYRELRDEAPVHYAPESETYTVSRHADVQRVLMTPEVFSSKTDRERRNAMQNLDAFQKLAMLVRVVTQLGAMPWTLARSRILIRETGEVHAVMRNLVNRGFTPRRISAWEGRVRELAQEGLERLRARGRFDMMEELAIPLPVTVIAEMLGVDPEDRHRFKHWSDAIIEGSTGSGMGAPGSSRTFEAMSELRRYLRPIVKARRSAPAEDLISTLVSAEGEAALSDHEIFLFVLLLLVAGNETTTNLLGNCVDALLDHPEQLERVCADPALVPQLVEETLRFDGPVQFVARQTLQDFEMHDVVIPAGSHVLALLGSANRDERHFEDPDRFDVTRDTRGHVAFGFGPHFCLGAALARLESRAALEILVPELPRLARVQPEPEFLDSYLIRGRSRLELMLAA